MLENVGKDFARREHFDKDKDIKQKRNPRHGRTNLYFRRTI